MPALASTSNYTDDDADGRKTPLVAPAPSFGLMVGLIAITRLSVEITSTSREIKERCKAL